MSDQPNAKRRKTNNGGEDGSYVSGCSYVAEVCFNAILAEERCPCGENPSLRAIYYKMKEMQDK